MIVAGEPRLIARRSGSSDRPIVRLEGSVSREDAEALRGFELLVEAVLEPDEYWARDLVGCPWWTARVRSAWSRGWSRCRRARRSRWESC